jgi:hypothetical protein
MKLDQINVGDQVIYIPEYLLIGPKCEMEKRENLGTVTSKNERFVFVRYLGNTGSQATDPNDLFTIRNREDLKEILNNESV